MYIQLATLWQVWRTRRSGTRLVWYTSGPEFSTPELSLAPVLSWPVAAMTDDILLGSDIRHWDASAWRTDLMSITCPKPVHSLK